MAANSRWIVLLGDSHLAVARVNRGTVEISDAHPYDRKACTETVEVVRRLLDQQSYSGEPVLLALGSSWCVSATVAVPSPRQMRKRAAMSFLLEPSLPWSAEDVVIDYEVGRTNRAFMVAAQVDPLAELIDSLEESGISVTSVTPLARLALEHHSQATAGSESRTVLLWRNDNTIDLWLIEDQRPAVWRWLPFDPTAVACALTHLALSEGSSLPVLARNVPDEFLQALVAQTGLECRTLPPLDSDDPVVSAVREAALVLEGRREAPIELRRDRLAAKDRRQSIRTHLRLLLASTLFLMLSLGLSLWVQARQTDTLRQACEQRQTALFRRLFPDQRVPVAVRTRLESELARLKGVRGERSDLPDSIPFLAVLDRLLSSLPSDLRFRLLEARIENGQLYLVGEVRAHGDADRIADALRRAGLDVPAPNTHRLEKQGVEFRISARLSGQDGKKPVRRPT
jgi:type II secretion system protein L